MRLLRLWCILALRRSMRGVGGWMRKEIHCLQASIISAMARSPKKRCRKSGKLASRAAECRRRCVRLPRNGPNNLTDPASTQALRRRKRKKHLRQPTNNHSLCHSLLRPNKTELRRICVRQRITESTIS